jgi:hypothetical protein
MEPFIYLENVLAKGLHEYLDLATYPIANVRESEDGAKAVIGSNIVLAETCSDVEGSNRMTFP